MEDKPIKQISFRVDTLIAEEMKAAAVKAGIRELGPFTRELALWAFEHYKNSGESFVNLKKARVTFKKVSAKRSRRR